MNSRSLHAALTLQKRLTLFRVTRMKYASLSGAGAAKTPGRWNEAKEEAVYTCQEAACAVLELLAHTQKDMIPLNMALMKICVTGEWIAGEDGFADHATGGRIRVMPTVQDAYQYFNTRDFFKERPFAMAVPSVVAPSLNVVLYPAHTGFWDHITLESVEPFEFDSRLFPEDATFEKTL